MKLAYASLNGLSAWYADLLLRISELQGWTSDFSLPISVWLPGFFNPQSFLTAIMQSTARKNELALDKMCLVCEVTKKMTREELTSCPKEGAHIHGLFMEVSKEASAKICYRTPVLISIRVQSKSHFLSQSPAFKMFTKVKEKEIWHFPYGSDKKC